MIAELRYFHDDKVVKEFFNSVFKIPLNPPLLKGDKNAFSPLAKGS
jgi:hypothetical protein